MKALGLALLVAVSASNPSAASWRQFFATVVPSAAHDFTSLRGKFDASNSNYAVKGVNPKLVRNCIIFATGALQDKMWQLRCDVVGYAGQAAGPGTPSQSALVRDLSAALPRFHLGSNMMGEPQWKSGKIAVTIVFGGILITNGNSDI